MSAITTHVLDLAAGRPGAGIAVALARAEGESWRHLGSSVTDEDGRARDLLPDGGPPAPGLHRLTFETGPYFAQRGVASFYPRVEILFELPSPPEAHYHVPLLLSPFGYSTYRGS